MMAAGNTMWRRWNCCCRWDGKHEFSSIICIWELEPNLVQPLWLMDYKRWTYWLMTTMQWVSVPIYVPLSTKFTRDQDKYAIQSYAVLQKLGKLVNLTMK
jgi:hypothetical protein